MTFARGALVRVSLLACAFACLRYFSPPAVPNFEVCGFHWLTGCPCPLCGLTRALFALAKGRVVEALRFNALSPLAAAMIVGPIWNKPLAGRLWSVGIASFAIYGVWRIVV